MLVEFFLLVVIKFCFFVIFLIFFLEVKLVKGISIFFNCLWFNCVKKYV